ncbi:polarity establishment/cellular polarization [Cryomyces antarcticus]|uniref:Polarity establishment/cellular polarization n=1 Tax=Cryomyces antarcticus TaxID=329879 RepID=A0ABR0KWK8_9PEZI|nr:polarity establishment/cellular polarization [Cryomyces antarcticus]KAK5131832.1 polarity establishment/cellular polarization [Cryomyces antarcticus]
MTFEVAFLLLLVVAAAMPEVAFPFNSQVPSVARVAEPFSFQFSATTFAPGATTFQYTLSGAPAWLNLDSPSRTLSGTPGQNDLGSATFSITAIDPEGTADMLATLIVVSDSAPHVQTGIAAQMAKLGTVAGSTSLILLPSTPFEFNLAGDTFVDGSSRNLSYYATLSDHTPLPSWVNFDAASLSFSGTAPDLSAFPQVFEIDFIVSDVVGFSGASVAFALVISNHQLSFSPSEQDLNATVGTLISFTTLKSQLILDGKPVSDTDLLQVSTHQLPSWLSFDQTSLALEGIPPPNTTDQDIVVVASDRFGDSANATVHLRFANMLFTGQIGPLHGTIGEEFNYTIDRSLLAQPDTKLKIDFGTVTPWLTFDSTTLNIHGNVPSDIQPENAMDSPTAGNPKMGRIIGIVLGVLGAILLLAALIIFLLWKRRRNWERRPLDPSRRQISRPMIRIEEWQAVQDRSQGEDIEKAEDTLPERTPDRPPQIALNLPTKQDRTGYRQSLASSIGDGEAAILADFNRSSWGYPMSSCHTPHDSMKIPTEMARLSRFGELSPTKRSPRKSRMGRASQPSSGLLINCRLADLRGSRTSVHGSPSRTRSRNLSTLSTLDRGSYASFSTESTSILSATPSAFPPPPVSVSSAKHLSVPGFALTEADKRRSIRLVSRSNSHVDTDKNTDKDKRSMAEKRQSYIRHRASTRSPFFASSRASSLQSRSRRQSAHATSADFESSVGNYGNSLSLRRRRTDKSLAATYSASSSVEPPLRVLKRGDGGLLQPGMADGFPRPLSRTFGPTRLARAASSSSFYSTASSDGDEQDDDGAGSAKKGEERRTYVFPGEASPSPTPTSATKLRHRARQPETARQPRQRGRRRPGPDRSLSHPSRRPLVASCERKGAEGESAAESAQRRQRQRQRWRGR